MSIFSKKIKCGYCGKNHKKKKARSKIVFACSTFDNYGKNFCHRNKVDEDFLIMLLKMRMRDNYSEDYAENKLDYVEVKEDCVTIHLKNEEPIISSGEYGQY
ncbi:MAG: recombinase zinc beta ribbon domain-containing protein [Candidatus Paceibacterota bacterium]